MFAGRPFMSPQVTSLALPRLACWTIGASDLRNAMWLTTCAPQSNGFPRARTSICGTF
jgi:hypothetical protein